MAEEAAFVAQEFVSSQSSPSRCVWTGRRGCPPERSLTTTYALARPASARPRQPAIRGCIPAQRDPAEGCHVPRSVARPASARRAPPLTPSCDSRPPRLPCARTRTRTSELTTRLSSRTSSHLKHIRPSSALNASISNPSAPYVATTINPATSKEANQTLPKIAAEFERLAALQRDKVALAEKLVGIVNKHNRRLELEVLGRVAELGGVEVPKVDRDAVLGPFADKKGGDSSNKSASRRPCELQDGQAASVSDADRLHLSRAPRLASPCSERRLNLPPVPMPAPYSLAPSYPSSSSSSNPRQQQPIMAPPTVPAHLYAHPHLPSQHAHGQAAARASQPQASAAPQQAASQPQPFPMFIPANSAYVSQMPPPAASSTSSATSGARGAPAGSKAAGTAKKRKARAVEVDSDDDAFGEDDALGEPEDEVEGADEGAGDDETLYCYCKQKSFGEVRPGGLSLPLARRRSTFSADCPPSPLLSRWSAATTTSARSNGCVLPPPLRARGLA